MNNEENKNSLLGAIEEYETTFAEIERMKEEEKLNPVKKARRTKEEILLNLKESEAKLDHDYARKKEEIEQKIKRLTLTTAERKAEKNKAETHAKIIAGVTALELALKGKDYFTIENFKNRLYNELPGTYEIKFLKKYFTE